MVALYHVTTIETNYVTMNCGFSGTLYDSTKPVLEAQQMEQANVQLKEVPEAKMVLEKYNLMTLGRNGWGIWAEIDRTGKMIDPTMIE